MLKTFWQSTSLMTKYVLGVSIVFVICGAIGYYTTSLFHSPTEFGSQPLNLQNLDRGNLLLTVVGRNLLVLGLEYLGVVTAGFTGLLQIAWNGFCLGRLLHRCDFLAFSVLVLPHSLLEFPAFIVGASASLWLVTRMIQRTLSSAPDIWQDLKRFLWYVTISIGLLLLGAVIEVFVTPIVGLYFLG